MNFTEYVGHATEVLRVVQGDAVEQAIALVYRAYEANRTVFIVGNGGSAAAASHLAQDLAKGVVEQTACRGIRALSLTDNVAYITAVANDESYDSVFGAQLNTFAAADDVLIAISVSGHSRNVLQAASAANSRGMSIVGVTGGALSPLHHLSDLVIRVPVADVGLVEGVHAVIFHYMVTRLRALMTGITTEHARLVPLGDLQPV